MSGPTTPSAPPSGVGSPIQPATTAAQAIALAATSNEGVATRTSPAAPVEQNETHLAQQVGKPLSQDDPATQSQSTEQALISQEQPPPPPQGYQPPVHSKSQSGKPQHVQQPLVHPVQHQPGQPHPHSMGPPGQPVYYYPPQQAHVPQPQPLGPLQPLPRGRPPRSKHPQVQEGTWGTPTSLQGARKPQLDLAYTRGGHLLGGYNPARYMGSSNANPKFDPDGKFFYLTGPSHISTWIQEVTYIAKALSCFDEMTRRFISFPPPNTIQMFICETRFATAFRVLEATIAGQVWAYMRVLGYSSLPGATDNTLMSPMPADCYEFAQLAASKMLVPGTPEQPQEERKRMVEEILTAQATEYPSERSYKKGIKWLRLACDNLIKQGDYDLAIALYDPVPDWARKPADYQDPTPATETGGTVPAASAEAAGGEEQPQPPSSVPASASPASIHPTPSPTVHNPAPSQTKAKKRKRSQKDEGPKPAQTTKTQPGSTAGA